MSWVAVAVGVGSAAVKIGTGISQKNKAKKLERSNKRPPFEIQQEYLNNQSLAQSMAQQGLTDEAMDYYTTEAQRGFSYGADTSLQLGGSVNNIASMYDVYQRGLQGIAAKDAELKTQNIRYLIDRNKDLAGQKTQQWAIDKYEPYKDKARAASQMRDAGAQNINTGISEIGAAAATYATSTSNNDMFSSGKSGAMAGDAIGDAGISGINSASPSMYTSGADQGAGLGYSEQQRIEAARRKYNYKDMDIQDMYDLQYGSIF